MNGSHDKEQEQPHLNEYAGMGESDSELFKMQQRIYQEKKRNKSCERKMTANIRIGLLEYFEDGIADRAIIGRVRITGGL